MVHILNVTCTDAEVSRPREGEMCGDSLRQIVLPGCGVFCRDSRIDLFCIMFPAKTGELWGSECL